MASPSEIKLDENEVTSEPQNDDQELDLAFPLMRQSSIYSLTLDEIQNTVCEHGKSFGSMNMDEFLTNIWNVEEDHFIGTDSAAPTAAPNGGPPVPPLHRQGSLTLPGPLCRKTVDEVWSEIHREQSVHHRLDRSQHRNGTTGNSGSAPRQPTFGEMTLEDFLIKAGVVREGYGPPMTPMTPAVISQPYYPMVTESPAAGFEYVDVHPAVGNGELGKRGSCYGGRFGNGYVGSPTSPVSSDGFGGGQVDNSAAAAAVATVFEGNGVKNGRKRAGDGAVVEKVVERRQRRMIKNRESAARSRARKQAYTVELEAELNLLKEENARLKEEEKRAQALRKQVLLECLDENARTNAEKTARSLRRWNTSPW